MTTKAHWLALVACLLASCTSQLSDEDVQRVAKGELVKIETVGDGFGEHMAASLLTLGLVDEEDRDLLSIEKVDGVPVRKGLFADDHAIAVKPGMHRLYMSCNVSNGDDEEWPTGPHPCKATYDVNFEAGYTYYVSLYRKRHDHHCLFQFQRKEGCLEPFEGGRKLPAIAIRRDP